MNTTTTADSLDVSAVAVPVFGAGGIVVAALELTVRDLRADQRLAQSVLTVAGRGLSRELATGTNATYFALSAEQPTGVRCVKRPEQAPAVRAERAQLPVDRRRELRDRRRPAVPFAE